MMKPILLAATVIAAFATAPLHAQTLYGLDPGGGHEADRDMYRMRVRQEVTGLLGDLKVAWDGDNAGRAAELYTRDGVLVTTSGDEIRSKAAVRERLEQMLPGVGPLQFSLQDFDTSGDMAFVRGTMSWAAADGSTPGQPQTFILIARRQRGDEWLIRSLTLSPAPPPAPRSAATAASPTGS